MVFSAPRFVSIMLLGSLALLACSHHRDDGAVDGVSDAGVNGRTDAGKPKPVDTCQSSNPYCLRDAAVTPPPSACGATPIDLDPVGVNIMVAVQGAASMGQHWQEIKDAIGALHDSHPDSQFGLQVFWGELEDSVQSGYAKSNWCGETRNNVLDVGNNSTQTLTDFMGDTPPGPSYVGGLFETSPVIEPLNYYLENMTKFADPTRTNYLVYITNGNDNCFGSLFTNNDDKVVAFQKLAIELGKRNIRIIPVGFDQNAKPNSLGIYDETTGTIDMDVLNTLLKYGGSGLTEVPKADDPAKLGDVIAQIGQSVRNCRFSIPAALDPTQSVNPFALDFLVSGMTVTRDRTNVDGWDFVESNTKQVELFGPSCQAVQNGAQVIAQKTCNTNVCGTAAIKVETKPRVVLIVFDVSASRIQCSDGTNNCLMLPNTPGRGDSKSFWEVTEHALGVSLASPINDDVEFGLQFFPSKDSFGLSCDVAATPEVPPGPGTEITILSKMLEKLPFGLSPVVQVMENIAAMPGRLADPDVQGAVVVLTDGGDDCTGATGDQNVQRLGAASAKLLAAGVKTYVVRYGIADSNSAQQDAELGAIVTNGGTAAMTDPNDPSKKPYVDAANDQALTDALTAISNSLATCSFALGDLPSSVDKSTVNIYLNGEAIPFDGQNTKQNGWGWLDTEQTTVQLYGDACTKFETNRKTSLNVELGCATVLVL